MREWSIIIPFWMTPCRERTRTYYHEHILHSLHSHTYSIRDQTTQRVNIELTLERRWRHTTRFRLIIRFGFVEEIMWWITLFVHVHQRGNYMSVLSIPLSGSGCCYVEGLLRKVCNHQIIGSVTHRPVSGIISATHTSSIHPCNDWSYAIDCKGWGPTGLWSESCRPLSGESPSQCSVCFPGKTHGVCVWFRIVEVFVWSPLCHQLLTTHTVNTPIHTFW